MMQRNKERNSCVSNVLYLITSVLFLSIGSNKVYAKAETTNEAGDGTTTIKSEETVYKYDENISITNNIIPSTFTFDDNDVDKYSVVIENKGTTNVNLHGQNPSFTLANNSMTEGSNGKGVIGIVMANNSKLDFTNDSNSKAKVILRHDIRSHLGCGNSTIAFKNNNYDKGSFSIDLGTNVIEANKIEIRSNTTLLLAINSEGIIGNLKGIGGNSELDIGEGNELDILIDNNSLTNIKMGESYAIVSGFNMTKEIRNRIRLAGNNTLVNINGEDIKTSILYKDNSIFIKFDKINPIQESDEAEDL